MLSFCPFSVFCFKMSNFYFVRYEKRHSNIPAHISPCFRVKEGDHVTIGQCRSVASVMVIFSTKYFLFID